MPPHNSNDPGLGACWAWTLTSAHRSSNQRVELGLRTRLYSCSSETRNMPNSRTLSLLLLLLLVSAEVIDVSARAQLGSNAGTRKSSTLKRPRKRQGRRRASKEDKQKTDDKATFVADFLKKTKCNLNQLPKLFRSARKRDITAL